MKLLISEHRNAGKLIPAKTLEQVKAAVVNASSFKEATATRDSILQTLRNKHGWSDKVKISTDSNISITSHKDDVGLCFQTGNMGRFYADLLKLEFLYSEQRIKAAFYILPNNALSKVWSANIANFERLKNEVSIFAKILHTPLYIIGIPKP